jgi:hypothetical protein
MGYLLIQAVLVVSLGRPGDMYGRLRVYNMASWSSRPPPWRCRSIRSGPPVPRGRDDRHLPGHEAPW